MQNIKMKKLLNDLRYIYEFSDIDVRIISDKDDIEAMYISVIDCENASRMTSVISDVIAEQKATTAILISVDNNSVTLAFKK